MGYYSTATGEITYSPSMPLYAKGISNIYKYVDNHEYSITLTFDWNTISPPEDSFKAYWIQEELTELVAEILKVNPETVFSGYFELDGEESGDLWRLRVKDGKVEIVKPKIVWPED